MSASLWGLWTVTSELEADFTCPLRLCHRISFCCYGLWRVSFKHTCLLGHFRRASWTFSCNKLLLIVACRVGRLVHNASIGRHFDISVNLRMESQLLFLFLFLLHFHNHTHRWIVLSSHDILLFIIKPIVDLLLRHSILRFILSLIVAISHRLFFLFLSDQLRLESAAI